MKWIVAKESKCTLLIKKALYLVDKKEANLIKAMYIFDNKNGNSDQKAMYIVDKEKQYTIVIDLQMTNQLRQV
jgi:hypothetical protein